MGGTLSNSTLEGALPEPLYPQLRARRNVSREAVAAHQRARLHGAMIEAVTAHGYESTTVNGVARLAGVSKKTLYRHFESKDDCLLRTYDLVVREATQRISTACRAATRDNGDWEAGLRRGFDAFAAELAERPKPSRLALVEMWAAGPDALRRLEGTEAVFARMIAQGLARAPDGVSLPPSLVRSLVGGCLFASRCLLHEERPGASAGSGSELLDWILSYRAAAAADLPRAAVARPSPRAGPPEAFVRAPGGFDESFLASLDRHGAATLARMLRESEDARDWPTGICCAVHALFCEIAENPEFARAAFVEVFAIGTAGAEALTALMRSFAALLVRRAPRGRRPSPLVAEAIVGAVWALARRHVAAGRARALPSLSGQAAYLVLAPIVGAEPAAKTISAAF